MHTLLHGIGDALRLIFTGDHEVWRITYNTLRIAVEATLIAAVVAKVGMRKARARPKIEP